MPLPGSKVIPDGWSEHHRPTVNKTMTATINLQRPPSSGAKTFDEIAGRSLYPAIEVLWTGPARIQRIARRGGEQSEGGRFAIVQLYQVSVPEDVPPLRINDQVAVTISGDDGALDGLVLRIREVRGGSLIWSRDLICEEVTPTTR